MHILSLLWKLFAEEEMVVANSMDQHPWLLYDDG